ncbi:cleavage and polyadenylation specificity factor subunit 6-like [Mangifera indica]|uniref:cleavage and polyadenylation specificity factor subunit 6-like n=1 Tax=Mangifera indica TaxID=29780 RepID=UPI001CFC128D|nr:cleavage and polyadenylation specificity factor subunit 6-like [Mangifera indica]
MIALMDQMSKEQIDYEDEEYGGGQKMMYQGGGAIPALADEELMGEDDEFDELYDDVNVGEGLLRFQQPEVPPPQSDLDRGNGGLQTQKTEVPEPRQQPGSSQGPTVTGASIEVKFSNSGTHFPPQNEGQLAVDRPDVGSVSYGDGPSVSLKGNVVEMNHGITIRNKGFQGSTSVPPKAGVNPSNMPGRVVNELAPLPNPDTSGPQDVIQISGNQIGEHGNVNRHMVSDNQIQPPIENGGTMLFVGELHWWTTDAELESVLSQYGRVKEIKFFDERASGKSKGYCQVEFYDSGAAAACKEGMTGYVFNGRACVVAFASPQTLKQMGASYMNKNQGQLQSQPQGRRPVHDGAGRGGNMNYQGGDGGRNYGRGGWGRGGQGVPNRGGPMRGRGGPMGAKNMIGSSAGAGSASGGGAYGQGLAGPGFGGPAGGMMHAQNMMGGFDPTYMGRGAGYGGFPGPGFPNMLPSYPAVNAMGLPGVAPHINPAFFSRGMAANGMGMMGSSGMDIPHPGMWTDLNMGGWGGEEHGRRTRESSYGGDDGASEYGYGEANHEKGVRSSAVSREKERVSERDWSGSSDRRHHEEREPDWDRSERDHRDHRYREEKENYRDHRQRERDSAYEDDWDRGQASSRSRNKSRAMLEEDYRSRSRDADYGKRRRLPSE